MPKARRSSAQPATLDDFIDGGGSTPKKEEPTPVPTTLDDTTRISVTIPVPLLELIDELRQGDMLKGRMRMERSQWLVQAALDKIKRDMSSEG